jgi:hypothetical protein
MHNISQADFRYNFFTLKTPQNIYPSWRKNRTESHFSKPNFDMQGPNCCKSNNVYGDPQIFNFLLVQKNIYSLSPLCTRSLTSAQAEIWFFNSSDSGCRTKGPMPNLGRLMVILKHKRSSCDLSYKWSVYKYDQIGRLSFQYAKECIFLIENKWE